MISRGKIFLLDDDDLIVSMLARTLTGEGYEVQAETTPSDVVDKIRSFSPHLTLLDIKLPGRSGLEILKELTTRGIHTEIVMLTSDDTAESAVKAMKMGAADYLTKPFHLDEFKFLVASILEKKTQAPRTPSDAANRDIIGSSAILLDLKATAEKLAKAGVPTVLITGENGTGKEMFARYIHGLRHAPADGRSPPFVGINCAALPESLIESELFGHDKGSFTDAKAEKKGAFELAAGGTLLLDEIGDMKWDLQAKLLRVLEDRRFRRVGGAHDIPVEATVCATTNQDLEEAVKNGNFRIDLFYRLATFSLHIPPLRERREDLLHLAQHFQASFAAKYGRRSVTALSDGAEQLLLSYDWPGNVRELRNVIERIVVLEAGDTILPEHLPKEIRFEPAPVSAVRLPEEGVSLDEVEKTLMIQALAKCRGNRARSAKLLGITYDSFRYQMKKFGLK